MFRQRRCLDGHKIGDSIMGIREEYVHRRLMELALIAETRELDEVEKEEERRLSEEAESFKKEEK